ncbi:hypothetical protein HY837_06270 [archaeon]|nr:hypothetical protein [archaeon]
MHDIQKKRKKKGPQPGTFVLTQDETRQLSMISLWIDDYNDIFSDFDPRPYSERALSVDFLDEANRATRDKASGQIVLKLLAPANKRKINDENTIKKRLKEHFKRRVKMAEEEIKKLKHQGLLFTVIGILLMISASFVLFKHPETSFLGSFLLVFLEPAGWFFFWEGLAMIIFESKKLKPNLEFNEKMEKCEYEFVSY